MMGGVVGGTIVVLQLRVVGMKGHSVVSSAWSQD